MKDLYIIDGIVYLYKYNNGVYTVLEDVLTGYEEFVRLEELKQYEYKNLLWKLWSWDKRWREIYKNDKTRSGQFTFNFFKERKRLLEEKLQEFE